MKLGKQVCGGGNGRCVSALLLLTAIGVTGGQAAIVGGTPDPSLDLTGYAVTFNDDFSKMDVSSYGPNRPGMRWIAHTPWNGDFGNDSFDNPGPGGPFAFGKNGLTITAHKDAAGNWHSGLLCSMDRDGPSQLGFAQRYGYFEIKAKLPDGGSGTWPAFWLIGVNKQVSSAEIDVMEDYGVSDRIYHSVEHIWQNGSDRRHLDHMEYVTPGMLSDQFNTYGVLIEPEQTSFYLNRHLIWSTPTPPEYQQPMYMLVNLAIGGGWPYGRLQSPQIMAVQYVRVFQKNGKN
jgi:beta-glucanase (GH16 family)